MKQKTLKSTKKWFFINQLERVSQLRLQARQRVLPRKWSERERLDAANAGPGG
jgi:hypothetical protein